MLRILWNINMHGFILGQRYCFFLRCANLATKKEVLKTSSFSCCQTRTRTQTDRTRICSATITPFGNVRLSSKASAKVLLFFETTKFFYKKSAKKLLSSINCHEIRSSPFIFM